MLAGGAGDGRRDCWEERAGQEEELVLVLVEVVEVEEGENGMCGRRHSGD